ncbi:hypothetical protein INR49_026162 [Caranx melampygus]|nr:hypothetical protein INR49_026162 [Caranx melampygus]
MAVQAALNLSSLSPQTGCSPSPRPSPLSSHLISSGTWMEIVAPEIQPVTQLITRKACLVVVSSYSPTTHFKTHD